jgi:hypothetical protein
MPVDPPLPTRRKVARSKFWIAAPKRLAAVIFFPTPPSLTKNSSVVAGEAANSVKFSGLRSSTAVIRLDSSAVASETSRTYISSVSAGPAASAVRAESLVSAISLYLTLSVSSRARRNLPRASEISNWRSQGRQRSWHTCRSHTGFMHFLHHAKSVRDMPGFTGTILLQWIQVKVSCSWSRIPGSTTVM